MLPKYKYPEVLILEMGADRPGDIKYLTSFIDSSIGIITDFSASHVEFFKNIEGVAKEKSILVKKLSKEKLAIINMDNPYVAKLKNQLRARVVGFGFSEDAQMKATDINFNYDQETQTLKGLSFKLNYRGTTIPVRLNNILAKHQIHAVLAAVAVGAELGINLVEAGVALEKFLSPCGRMTLIEGMEKSFIIDDTYNASPVSVMAALDSLNEIVISDNNAEKIVVLGDMLELGDDEDEKHRLIGRKIGELGCKYFIAVGDRMRLAGEELEKNGFLKSNIFYFSGPIEAAKKVKSLVGSGNYILVKGSQGMRMEKVVEGIMQNPQLAEKLLCRQNERWKENEWKKV
jgi:UDP-N-acetylmuramoyl-tripeptide--D-alanyl-D-alanine ligase